MGPFPFEQGCSVVPVGVLTKKAQFNPPSMTACTWTWVMSHPGFDHIQDMVFTYTQWNLVIHIPVCMINTNIRFLMTACYLCRCQWRLLFSTQTTAISKSEKNETTAYMLSIVNYSSAYWKTKLIFVVLQMWDALVAAATMFVFLVGVTLLHRIYALLGHTSM